ncbi:MAG TPA: ATP-binding protein [Rhizomicrobium sp.]|nr:ATP-binding protein [Rhizomicrobium sp.]
MARAQLRSYVVMVGMFLSLLVVALTTSWAAIDLVNDTRAYATGEGRYSKAEKMAVLDLYRYADSRNQADYDAFERDIAVPRGDRAARLALTRTPADLGAAADGFLRGQNHPSDVGGLIRLFRWFSWWQPFVAAIGDWRVADEQVGTLIDEAEQLHRRIVSGRRDSKARAVTLARIEAVDRDVTDRENTFSTHMGEAARAATTLVVAGLGVTTVLLWAIGIVFATRLFRRQVALDHQLAMSESRFRDYAEVASDWYWEMNRDNRITYMSERIYDIMNVSAGTVIDFDGVTMIRESATDPEHRDACIAAMAERRPFRALCLRFIARDGADGFAAISGKPTFDATGAFLGYRGIGADITAQVRDAQTLRDAKTRAEVANRAKSEFLANMSHELRTPLNAILGFSDIISRRLFGEDAMDRYAGYAGDIHDSGAHLLAIINDILDLSKIEAGHTELDETHVPLDAVFDEARRLLGDRPDGLDFRVRMPAPPPVLRADERKLVQILVNLLSNACKFTPAGGSVTLAAERSRDGSLALSVRDTGIGIAPEDIDKVLSPFGQVESAFSRSHHGTGLGLPLAKSLAELHGGALVLESVQGSGTTVTVTLPRARVVAAPPAEALRA